MDKTFVVIFGPAAVGKMTVGYALQDLTGLRLLHNHMTIDLVLNFFNWGDPEFGRLNAEFRRRILEEIAASDLPGAIFTFVWALELPEDRRAIDGYRDLFAAHGGRTAYVELYADQTERLVRNTSAFRLEQKVSKRDVDASTRTLLAHDENYKLNTDGDFFYPDDHLKLDTTHLTPADAARVIAERFDLPIRDAAGE
jgi:hypothetical protein